LPVVHERQQHPGMVRRIYKNNVAFDFFHPGTPTELIFILNHFMGMSELNA